MKPTGVAIVMVSAVLAGVCLMIVAPLAVRTLVYEPYTVPSAAMEPTLQQGDYLIVSKAAYGYGRHSIWGSPPGISGRIRFHSPERGDVVVFKLPRDGRTSYIKRLIGQPGDKVQITRGIVSINGKSLPQQPVRSIATTDGGPPGRAEVLRETTPEGRSYLIENHGGGDPQDNTGVYVVPPHCFFVLGDNRDNSADSRFDPGLPPNDPKLGGCGWDSKTDAQVGDDEGIGFVPEENLVGKALMVMRQNASGGVETVMVQ